MELGSFGGGLLTLFISALRLLGGELLSRSAGVIMIFPLSFYSPLLYLSPTPSICFNSYLFPFGYSVSK